MSLESDIRLSGISTVGYKIDEHIRKLLLTYKTQVGTKEIIEDGNECLHNSFINYPQINTS